MNDTHDVWVQQQKIVPTDLIAHSYFGCSVGMHRDHLVVGAYQAYGVGSNTQTGLVYSFGLGEAMQDPWTLEQKLVAFDAEVGDSYGHAVALSHTHMVIGAHMDRDLGQDSGSVYVYKWLASNSTWELQEKMLESGGSAGHMFGSAIDLSDTHLAIGAVGTDDEGRRSGAVHLYEMLDGVWVKQSVLKAADAAANSEFGVSVELVTPYLFVGAENAATLTLGEQVSSGAVYMFE